MALVVIEKDLQVAKDGEGAKGDMFAGVRKAFIRQGVDEIDDLAPCLCPLRQRIADILFAKLGLSVQVITEARVRASGDLLDPLSQALLLRRRQM